jgi:hypothetical protein
MQNELLVISKLTWFGAITIRIAEFSMLALPCFKAGQREVLPIGSFGNAKFKFLIGPPRNLKRYPWATVRNYNYDNTKIQAVLTASQFRFFIDPKKHENLR